METLLKILNEIDETIDWENETDLMGQRRLDSFAVITLVTILEGAFSIEIEAREMTAENFNSVESMYRMIQRLRED